MQGCLVAHMFLLSYITGHDSTFLAHVFIDGPGVPSREANVSFKQGEMYHLGTSIVEKVCLQVGVRDKVSIIFFHNIGTTLT